MAQVVVEIKAGGPVGLQRLMRAEPDGLTIVLGIMGVLAAAMVLNLDSGFDPRRDLTVWSQNIVGTRLG
ncbi:hypothetical protein JMJ56_25545 [Belnapia sp. T18]|uniref:Uncharacterized protein n=1 Tax=Belnapia arida TaxID=2804533 RepID=A0ABS1U9K4_9PROT|nr:tripartite tricarboxylate transporter substrate-binding protein [Belnapia arida]MBL6081365.1 hypothetical protein [Belnapia arida]